MHRFFVTTVAATLLLGACGESSDRKVRGGGPPGTGGAPDASSAADGSANTGGSETGGASGTGGAASTDSGGQGTGGAPPASGGAPAADAAADGAPGTPDAGAGFDLSLQVSETPLDVTHLSFEAGSSLFIGAIDRYLFDFTWDSTPPGADDDARLVATIRLQSIGPDLFGEAYRTFTYGEDAVFEPVDGTFTLFGFAILQADVTLTDGFITLRRDGDRLVGGVHLELAPTDGTWPGPIVATAPIDVPDPAL